MKFEIKVHKSHEISSPVIDIFTFHCDNSYAGIFNPTYINLFTDEVRNKRDVFIKDLRKCLMGRYGINYKIGVFPKEIMYEGKSLFWVTSELAKVRKGKEV